MMTQAELEAKVNAFFESEAKHKYEMDHESENPIGDHPYYCYLKKCVIDYREFNDEVPLRELLKFLSIKANVRFLAGKLMDKAVRKVGEYWSSGKHEYLLRSLIVDVLRRSAGMVEGVESHKEGYCMLPPFDWLDVQHELRTNTKTLFPMSSDNTITVGHVGAVKSSLEPGKGRFRIGSMSGKGPFHTALVEAFHVSKSIGGFLRRVKNIIRTQQLSGKRELSAASTPSYLVDGSPTNNALRVNLFRVRSIRPDYEATKMTAECLKMRAFEYDDETASVSSVDTTAEEAAGWRQEAQEYEEARILRAAARLFIIK